MSVYRQILSVSKDMDESLQRKIKDGYWKKFKEYGKAIKVLQIHSRNNQTKINELNGK